MANVLLGVTGSVACYKAAALTRRLREGGAAVQVVVTPAAARLVGAATFRALSGQVVLEDEWERPQSADGMDHIAAARRADVLLVAPASADFIAKAAAGIADNLLLATFLAAGCPRLLAPAMNPHMWAAAATGRNVQTLAADGARILGPAAGETACGEAGLGRMADVEAIAAAALQTAAAAGGGGALAGRRVVVSAGATVEKLDAMRTISNRSSGRMGFCLAAAAAAQGAEVVVLAGQTSAAAPAGVRVRRAVFGEEMRRAALEESEGADWFFSVAAVADFFGADAGGGKAAREKGAWTVELLPTADILAEVAAARPGVRCVAFAAQTGMAEEQERAAREKMARKGAVAVALNDASAAGEEECEMTLLFADGGRVALPKMGKGDVAVRLLEEVVRRVG